MRSRDERFENQDKYKGKPSPLSEKVPTGRPKEVKRFRPQDFTFNDDSTATCPAGSLMTSPGTAYTTATGLHYQTYTAKAVDCNVCQLSKQCLNGPLKPNDGRGRQVTHSTARHFGGKSRRSFYVCCAPSASGCLDQAPEKTQSAH
jgi:hypothetical protein